MPYWIVTSRVNDEDYMKIDMKEHSFDYEPLGKQKKIVVMTGRVHPGESNSSFMMEGFIKFITSNNPIAQ